MDFRHYILYALLLSLLGAVSCTNKSEGVKSILVRAEHPDDIFIFNDSIVEPVEYTSLPSLQKLIVDERKKVFINMILPSILVSKYELNQEKEKIIKLMNKSTFSRRERRYLKTMYKKYKSDNLDDLLEKVHPHPTSVVLAQAAVESAWGTSRFYKEGKNLFGIWSFNEKDNRMSSQGVREGKQVYLKKYNSLKASVDDYFLILGRGPYAKFREVRISSEDPLKMIEHLLNYSELKSEYISMLVQVIQQNDLTRYDSYQIDPSFIE